MSDRWQPPPEPPKREGENPPERPEWVPPPPDPHLIGIFGRGSLAEYQARRRRWWDFLTS